MRFSYAEFEAQSGAWRNSHWFLIQGEESYLRARALELLLGTFLPKEARDQADVLDGKGLEARRLLESAQTLGFFSEGRVVIVQRAQEMKPEEQEALAKSLDRIASDARVVLLVEQEDGEKRRGGGLARPLTTALGKVGAVINCATTRRKDEAASWVTKLARELGKPIQATAAASLVERVGKDLARLRSELEKLTIYAADSREITKLHVEAATSPSVEEKVFSLVDAMVAGQTAQALEILRGLLREDRGKSGIMVLGYLARHFRAIWEAKILHEAGWRPSDKDNIPERARALLSDDAVVFSVLARQSWKIQEYLRIAREMTWPQLAAAIEGLQRTDLALKEIEGSIRDPQVLLDLLVARLAQRKR